MAPIYPWQNSSPFFGAVAFCMTKNDDFRGQPEKRKRSKKSRQPPKVGVHSSHIKCKDVQLTQINWKELANILKNVVEHPSRETKYWMLSNIFQYFSVQ